MSLPKFLRDRDLSNADFGAMIGVTGAAVGRYLKDQIPRKAIMRRIYDATGGLVDANSFYGLEPKKFRRRRRVKNHG